VFAGLCGFLLGLVHSYDVLSVGAVWLTYLLINTLRPLRTLAQTLPSLEQQETKDEVSSSFHAWPQALLAGAITAPSVAYIYVQYRTEAVFRARANVATLSAP